MLFAKNMMFCKENMKTGEKEKKNREKVTIIEERFHKISQIYNNPLAA